MNPNPTMTAKQRWNRLIKTWLKIIGIIVKGWLLYLPFYIFWSSSLYMAFRLTGLATFTFWECVGLMILLRVTKNIFGIKGDLHHKSDLHIDKEPYQVPGYYIPNGLCFYGDKLLVKTNHVFYEVATGEPFQEDGKQFTPVQLTKN